MLPIGHQFSPLGRRLPIQVDICRHCQRDLFLLPLVSTSSVQALAKTDCHSGFTYAETHALDANSFFITTRCTSTFGSGTFHPTVTVTMEYVTFGLITKWITDGTVPAQRDWTASTWKNLYAEATPYRILSPPLSQTGNQAPSALSDTEAGSTISPGALAGIAIGGVLVLVAAVFFLWRRRLAKLKSEQNARSGDDMAGRPGLERDQQAAATGKGYQQKQQPPPYELGNSQLVVFPVEADHGQEHGHEHELPVVFSRNPGLQELPDTTSMVCPVGGEGSKGTG